MSSSTIFRSRWLLPIDRAPIDGGWMEVSADRIVAIGAGRPSAAATDLGDVAILPGLVNAHTHLELSWMAGLVPPAGTMDHWIRTLMHVRRTGPPGGMDEVVSAATDAAASMYATGTVLVGDVSNALTTFGSVRAAGLGGVIFHEVLGFSPDDPAAMVRQAWERVRHAETSLNVDGAGTQAAAIEFSVVAHAPYSVSPALFGEIVRRAEHTPLSVHLAESPQEMEFLRTGRGPIREMLETLGVWAPAWRVPACDPVQYIATLGYLQPGVLVVHGVHLTDDNLDRLREAGAVLVTCPRSNEWVGGGVPRLSHFYASGVPVAVGTDSLASTSSLNLFDELAEMRRLAPEVAAGSLLESATRIGADALGFGRDYGTLTVGKRAAAIAVDVPAGMRDVEEYLVGGVPAASIRRLPH